MLMRSGRAEVTANLIIHMLGVDEKWVHPLPMNSTTVLPDTGGVEVTLIDANHCTSPTPLPPLRSPHLHTRQVLDPAYSSSPASKPSTPATRPSIHPLSEPTAYSAISTAVISAHVRNMSYILPSWGRNWT
jgi:hypothetical protein